MRYRAIGIDGVTDYGYAPYGRLNAVTGPTVTDPLTGIRVLVYWSSGLSHVTNVQ